MNKLKHYLIAGAIVALVIFIGYEIWLVARPIPLEIQGEVEATHR